MLTCRVVHRKLWKLCTCQDLKKIYTINLLCYTQNIYSSLGLWCSGKEWRVVHSKFVEENTDIVYVAVIVKKREERMVVILLLPFSFDFHNFILFFKIWNKNGSGASHVSEEMLLCNFVFHDRSTCDAMSPAMCSLSQYELVSLCYVFSFRFRRETMSTTLRCSINQPVLNYSDAKMQSKTIRTSYNS